MISIIVPVFNTEKYLTEAIQSVISQSYTDWELILIDDGSTDSSPDICERFSSEYENIKVLHKPNGGLSSARNKGLEIATGDFIFFLDSDDILPPRALQILIERRQLSKADIICGEMRPFSDTIPSLPDTSSFSETFTPHEAVETILYQKKMDNSAWGKLYVANLWKNTRFREGTYYEDIDIFYEVFFKANIIERIKDVVYLYRQHSASYIHTFNLRRKDMLSVTQRLVEYMEKNTPSMLPAARSRQLSANFNMYALISRYYSKLAPDTIEEANELKNNCWKKIKELRKESLFNPKVRLKNKAGILISYLGGKNLLAFLSKFFY